MHSNQPTSCSNITMKRTNMLSSLAFAAFALAALIIGSHPTNAHVEDICVAPPGKCLQCGIYNFYTMAEKLGCTYLEDRPKCVGAALKAQSAGGFAETSNCRGIIHFNAIYFTAVALGFKRDIAYQMSAFSQAIDFVQYKGVDSCGRAMNKSFWTPPLRGLLRTETSYGGTNRHLGVPLVGFYESIDVYPPSMNTSSLNGEPLRQREKQYKGLPDPDNSGCQRFEYKKTNTYYAATCAGLKPNFSDPFYEGSLYSAKKWAFGESDQLCIAGFTERDPATGSIFTGKECPTKGQQYQVNIGSIVQGPIPLTGAPMQLGEQVFHFECSPNCSTPGYTAVPSTMVRTRKFGEYLRNQSRTEGYAVLQDPPGPVPELVARFGIFLHWVADRNSHWYCCDASASGVKAVRDGDHYNVFMYLSKKGCNFVNHGMVHYWEQGVSELAPGSYFALVNTYQQTLEFRNKYLATRPEWFRADAKVMTIEQVVGNKRKPGILYKVTNIPNAKKRFLAEIRALEDNNLPAMPGFEGLCPATTASIDQSLRGSKSSDLIEEEDYDEDDADL